jgi:PBP1b-binding outer membrane lipoprotein LpoB
MIVALLATVACGSSQKLDFRIDPDAVGTDQGTLISIGDIRSVAQIMIDSMNESARLAKLRKERNPLKVLVGKFKHRTSIAIFDKLIFVNRVLSSLVSADTEGVYAFIRREDVERERREQQSGAVETSQPGTSLSPSLPGMTGADYVLSGEVREILHRQPESGGGELEKRTIQYTLRLASVADGTLIWTEAHEVVKMQIIGAVYR